MAAEVRPSPREPAAAAGAAQRLVSLDAFRGFVMLWIVGGGTLVKSFREIEAVWLTDFLVYQLEHSDWTGLRFYDLIWPGFMLMTGMSLPFSYRSRLRRGASHSEVLRQVAWRCSILFLLGSLRESVHLKQPFLVELLSALKPIAIAYFCAFLLLRWSMRAQAAVAAGIWAGYAAMLALISPESYPRGDNLAADGPGDSRPQDFDHRRRWDRLLRRGLGVEPGDPGDHEAVDHLLRPGLGGGGLPDVRRLLLGDRRSGLPALELAAGGHRKERPGRLSRADACSATKPRRHLHAGPGGGARPAVAGAAPHRAGSGYRRGSETSSARRAAIGRPSTPASSR